MRYLIIVQPGNGSRDHWLSSPTAATADHFARWVHKATSAAVDVYDEKTDSTRLTLGEFDRART